jgi:protoporphyrinogen oxidase
MRYIPGAVWQFRHPEYRVEYAINPDGFRDVKLRPAGKLAGVTAAFALRQRRIPVRLYEPGRQIAGLAASFRDKDGFTNDFGTHFVTNRLAAAIGVGDQCRDVRHYGEAVLLADKVYGYPFGLLGNPRFFLSGIAARAAGQKSNGTSRSAAEWFRATYGPALADAVAIPLVEAWSGASAESLAPTVASEKLRHSVPHTLYLKLASQVTGRAVASGYSHEMPESPAVWHVYHEGGVSTLVQRLAHGLEDAILLESPVEAIVVDSTSACAAAIYFQTRCFGPRSDSSPFSGSRRRHDLCPGSRHLERAC